MNDLRYALRSLAKNPGFSAIAIVTLALGIGANTAIFSAVDAVLLKPLPYPNADRLVSLDTKVPGPGKDIFGSSMSYPDIQQLQTLTSDFAGVAAYRDARYNYSGPDQALELAATVVSPNLFEVLGVSPAVGRGFTGAELRDRLAVLSYGMWATAFGGDRNIVGRAITLDGQSFTVVGVMPRGFAFPNEDTQLWVPLGEALRAAPQLEFNRHFYAFQSVARLAAGGAAGRGTARRSAARVHPPLLRLSVRGTPGGGRHARAGARRRRRGGAADRIRLGVRRRSAEGGRRGERPLRLAGAVRRGGAGAVDRLRQRGGAVRGARHQAPQGGRRARGSGRKSRGAGAAAPARERGGAAHRGGRNGRHH